jgi:hypothetical protein
MRKTKRSSPLRCSQYIRGRDVRLRLCLFHCEGVMRVVMSAVIAMAFGLLVGCSNVQTIDRINPNPVVQLQNWEASEDDVPDSVMLAGGGTWQPASAVPWRRTAKRWYRTSWTPPASVPHDRELVLSFEANYGGNIWVNGVPGPGVSGYPGRYMHLDSDRPVHLLAKLHPRD